MTDLSDRKLVNAAAKLAEDEGEHLYGRRDFRYEKCVPALTRYLIDHREDWYPIQQDDDRFLKAIQDFHSMRPTMTIYGYARESTRKQELGMKAQIQELKKAGCDKIIQDKGQSGWDNLIESKAWQSIADEITGGDKLCVWSQSRLGRDNTEVAWVIGRLTKRGIAIQILEEDRLITDMNIFAQNATMTLKGLVDHSELVDNKKRTNGALSVLKEAGVRLGRKPELTEKDVKAIRDLRGRGLGYVAIGKVVRRKLKSTGQYVNTSPRVVKKVLDGTYISLEQWEHQNALARISLAKG